VHIDNVSRRCRHYLCLGKNERDGQLIKAQLDKSALLSSAETVYSNNIYRVQIIFITVYTHHNMHN